ncbi:uncharacterized protein N7518_004092 [Penicillium psychrosexuale]|uniref:uncharacterized protein n=1 Tax=Penicillium psychrosexuale TaxID=1002107 RepID=UPI002545349C|nr:uncharacterized protein N7518_004092 [Penicillium psychrosexuale]KAJ5795552.1 hypothetical protein N7518_004092 [Penicillium psychrosexuale]
MPEPTITLYTIQTPNGIKISIALEMLGLQYRVEKIDISRNVQKEDWFLKINPNGHIPALTDLFSDGKEIRLFESGSILEYLAEQYDHDNKISFPRGTREYYAMKNWLFFQNASLGPMQGQANHFTRYAPERIEYGVNRYVNECRRLYGVLDKHLATCQSGWLVGDHVSIADISHWGWIAAAGWADIDIDEFPNVKAWEKLMASHPGTESGRHVPSPHTIKDLIQNKAAVDKTAAEARSWIQQGMQAQAKGKV